MGCIDELRKQAQDKDLGKYQVWSQPADNAKITRQLTMCIACLLGKQVLHLSLQVTTLCV